MSTRQSLRCPSDPENHIPRIAMVQSGKNGRPVPLHDSKVSWITAHASARADSIYHVEDSAERTTQLAADRTVFAAERTYAAWVRTGLLAMASGIGAKALLEELLPQWLIIATGSVLVLFSAFCFGAAVWRHLEPGVPPPRVDVSHIPPWIFIAVNGFLVLVALAALLGIWFGRAPSLPR